MMNSLDLVLSIPEHHDSIKLQSFNRNGLFAILTYNGLLIIYDSKSKKILTTIQTPMMYFISLMLLEDKLIAFTTIDFCIYNIELSTLLSGNNKTLEEIPHKIIKNDLNDDEYYGGSFSPDGKWLCTYYDDLKIWDTETFQLFKTLGKDECITKKCAFSNDSKFVSCGTLFCTIKLWEFNSPSTQPLKTFEFQNINPFGDKIDEVGDNPYVYDYNMSCDGKYCAFVVKIIKVSKVGNTYIKTQVNKLIIESLNGTRTEMTLTHNCRTDDEDDDDEDDDDEDDDDDDDDDDGTEYVSHANNFYWLCKRKCAFSPLNPWLLAIASECGHIQFINIITLQIINEVSIPFKLADEIKWSHDGSQLIVGNDTNLWIKTLPANLHGMNINILTLILIGNRYSKQGKRNSRLPPELWMWIKEEFNL